MESNLITEDKQKNKLEKAFEILKTMASKPSGLIGLTIVLFHVVLALISPYIAPYDYKAISPNTMLLHLRLNIGLEQIAWVEMFLQEQYLEVEQLFR